MDRTNWSRKLVEPGVLQFKNWDDDPLPERDTDLEQFQAQLKYLKKLTKEEQIKSLQSDVEKARADEVAKLQTYQLERSRQWWWAFLGF